jgi:abortive infection bacteriophage resistance protein
MPIEKSTKYNKPPLLVGEQIKLLISRGLCVEEDDETLIYYLQNISYYHLSIYFKFFQTKDDVFNEGTTFDDVVRIYNFDNKLRLLLLEILERVEKSFKARTAYNLSNYNQDAHCHTNKDLYIDISRHNTMQTMFEKVYVDSSEISINHYRSRYNNPTLPPIWTMVEILSFGQVVKYVKGLTRFNQNLVARSLGADASYTLNWIHCLSVLRNTCAHHSRLWNRELTLTIKTKHDTYEKYFNNNKRLFNYLVALQILLNEINPTSSWQDKLEKLIEEYNVNVNHMGFPDDWKERLSKIKSL